MTRKVFHRLGAFLLCLLLALSPTAVLADGGEAQGTKDGSVNAATVESGENFTEKEESKAPKGEDETAKTEKDTAEETRKETLGETAETTTEPKTEAPSEPETTKAQETAATSAQEETTAAPETAEGETEPAEETSSEEDLTGSEPAGSSEEVTETEAETDSQEPSGETETEGETAAPETETSPEESSAPDQTEETSADADETEDESLPAETTPAETGQAEEPTTEADYPAILDPEEVEDFSDIDTIENLDRTPMWHSEWLNAGSSFMLRMYQKIDAEKIMADEDTAVFMKDDFTSEKTARLERGAIVFGLDRTASDYIFIEAKDADGKIVRGYVSARMMQVAPLGMEEDLARIHYLADGNFSYVDCMLTALDELVGKKVTTAVRADLVNYALKWLGHPYVLGGNSLENGIDCSGFCKKVYAMFDEQLPRKSRQQALVGRRISSYDVMPGDLLFHMKDGRVHHVMICISNDGNGHLMVVHARSRQYGILVNKMNAKNLCWGVSIFPREDEVPEACSVKSARKAEPELLH